MSTCEPPQGLPDLVELILSHLDDDPKALKQLALMAMVFSLPARKALFRHLKFMNNHAVQYWQSKLTGISYNATDVTPPFEFVKELTFSLQMDYYRCNYVVELIDDLSKLLTRLEAVHIYGYDALYNNSPGQPWLTKIVNAIKPEFLSFNGMRVPKYIFDFDFPSTRTVHFNNCRLFYENEDWRIDGPRQPTIDAQVVLRPHGKGWKRVEEVISNAINGETLQLIRKTEVLKALCLRVVINQVHELPQMLLPSGLQSLCLQVPVAYSPHLPYFVQQVIRWLPRLRQLDIYYEDGWYRHSTSGHLVEDVMESLLSSLYDADSRNGQLEIVCCRFKAPPKTKKRLGEVFWTRNVDGIQIRAICDDDDPCYVPVPLPSDYHAPFMTELALLLK